MSRPRPTTPGALGALAALILASCDSGEAPSSSLQRPGIQRPGIQRPGILVVVSDTLRRDHLSCYGYERETSPRIDAFAADAALYENAYAQSPSTKPSVASLFTSTFPSQHRIVRNEDRLSELHVTLAELLSGSGYRCAGFVENPVIDAQYGFGQGFDTWELDARREATRPTAEDMRGFDERIHAWLAARGADPFFLYVHYIDPHSPYTPPEAFQGIYHRGTYDYELRLHVESRLSPAEARAATDRYDEEIRYVDHRFGALVAELEELGILDETVVVFLSDHGEGLDDHGLMFHSYAVYSELINVPLILRYPPRFPPGRRSEAVQHVDVFPTLLELAGVPVPETARGTSLLAPERGDAPILSEHLREGWGIPQRALIRGGWKLVHHLPTDTYELFDLRADPTDSKSVLRPDRPHPVARELRRELAGWLAELPPAIDPERVELDEQTQRALHELGYAEE